MRGKACIVYGCMRTKDVKELEGTGKFYCGRHFPKDKYAPAKGQTSQPKPVRPAKKVDKAA